MAQYQITRILTVQQGSALMADRMIGPGWADSANNILNYVKTGAHAFYLDMAGKRVWLSSRTNTATGRPELVATGPDGEAITLDHLPIDWTGERMAPAKPAQPGWLNRIMNVGRR
ncbi:MAG: hypothetical protein WCO82_00795 [Sphingomonadales bacterium]|jgi:hypothetical protein